MRGGIVKLRKFVLLIVTSLALIVPNPASAASVSGRVLDSLSHKPIAGAIVTSNERTVRTAADGTFHIDAGADWIGIRAYGHGREEFPLASLPATGDFELAPITPKALYLSFYGIGSRVLREGALSIANRSEINALVIDIKGDRGMIAFQMPNRLAAEVGALDLLTIKDVKLMLRTLHERHLYAIARIVVFKDNPLATEHPDYAVRTRGGAIFHDREHLAWTDPFRTEVWDYNIAVAVEAAKAGFDEIQFDYVRFPDVPGGLVFSQPVNRKSRVGAVNGFLGAAYKALTPYNVFVAADIFGYVSWNEDDTHIGQQLEDIPDYVDYVCPMLYPSGYQFGIPGYRNPIAHPFEIVHLTLDKAQQRTALPAIRFRPWLQAFRDYAFGGKRFTGTEIRLQIDAAEEFGSNGWMLWNPNNRYTTDGLK